MRLRVPVCLLPAETGGTRLISLCQQPSAILRPHRAPRMPLPPAGHDMSLG